MSVTSLALGRRRTNSSRRGSAVALALVCVTVVAGLAVAFLRISTSATSRQMAEVENLRAFYLAEAGLAESFQALRIGRTGQVGSETEPAAAGNGLLWVDAIETVDGQVRLESTALVGTGRATLALIVEPIEIPLGFFSDEDLIVESVLMVDGFDSEEGSYGASAGEPLNVDPSDHTFHAETVHGILFFEGSFYRYHAAEGDKYWCDHSVEYASLLANKRLADAFGLNEDDFTDHDPGEVSSDWLVDHEYGAVLHYFSNIPRPEEVPLNPNGWNQGPTTGDGGLLSSNGNVSFNQPADESAAIFGDVIPGPTGSVTGTGNFLVSGDTDSRDVAVELQAVDVPAVALSAPTRHNGLLPMVVSPGISGWQRIEVAADAELTLRGPATIVIGELVLESGAKLTLDTRDGDVSLYVTGEMDLQPGSLTTTTSDKPNELTVQVPAIPTVDGDIPIKLDSNAQFHGTVYAPETEVYVGSNFEVYGGIVAKKLEIGPGARLHFDNAGFEGTPIPRLVSWQIVEIKNAAKNRSRNLFKALGIDKTTLPKMTEAHDLSHVNLKLEYIALNGSTQSFIGLEEDFDWELVKDILAVSRDASREKEEGAGDPRDPVVDPEDPVLSEDQVRETIGLAFDTLSGKELKDFLISKSPLNESELLEVLDLGTLGPMQQRAVLEAASPLSEPVLTDMMDGTSALESLQLRRLLLASSPLPPEVLQSVQEAPTSLLSASDRDLVLGAN